MRVSDCTVERRGLLPVTPPDLSLYVPAEFPSPAIKADQGSSTALRRIRFHQGVRLWPPGLPLGDLVPELCRFHRRFGEWCLQRYERPQLTLYPSQVSSIAISQPLDVIKVSSAPPLES